MEDLLDNFASQSLDSPSEEGYKYHFVNGSPTGSQHARPAATASPASVGPSPQTTGGEKEYEGDVDNDDDDDDDDENERYDADLEGTNGASYPQNARFEDIDYHSFEPHGASSGANYGNAELSLSPSDDGWDGFALHLRRLHRQDMERDELLTQLHHENQDLKRTLKESVPGGNPRAEAAERSLFEIRKTLDNNPYVCVLIDGKGYKIHEDLLQSGKRGGVEAADRLWTEVSNYVEQFPDAERWEIMVHLYIDVQGLLARCVSADVPLSDRNVRDFMVGFTKARPLFTTTDVGHDTEKFSRKVEGMFHLFANNVQCKHLIFGCCHNSAYAVTLEPYASNPITASSVTLLKSYEDNTYFEGLPFNSVRFPHIFRSTPFKETGRLAEDVDYRQVHPQIHASGGISRDLRKNSANEAAGGNEALGKGQAASNASIPLQTRKHGPINPRSTWGSNQTVLLNINDERVDPPLLEEDYDTSESMKDRMEVKRFCHFYHLLGTCASVNPSDRQVCRFRHGSELSPQETVVLRNYVKELACVRGSKCRQPDCIFGHICHGQPECTKGARCLFYKFHEVDPTVVRVWQP